MKHDELRSIAHNIADSLASGIGLLVGVYEMEVFGEAAASAEGFITVDFLTGTTEGGAPSASLAAAIGKYRDALPGLCEKHGCSADFFRVLTARYAIDDVGRQAAVTIEDANGRRSIDEYRGIPLKHVKALDHRGRIRTKRH